MKIYTKTGDTGETALYGGKRLSKADIKIECYGTVDELNSTIGVIVSLLNESKTHSDIQTQLIKIQSRLFDIGTHLAAEYGKKNLILPEINNSQIAEMEQQIDQWQAQLPELKNFILPGGNIIAAHTHIARTVCRRAERMVVALTQQEEVQPILIHYLNRLSDYLFVLARYINFTTNTDEIIWQGR
jgi:cob(I)alamin adenosyltransferase